MVRNIDVDTFNCESHSNVFMSINNFLFDALYKKDYSYVCCKYCKRKNLVQLPKIKYRSKFFTQYFRCKYCNKINMKIGLEPIITVILVLVLIILSKMS